MEVDEKPSKEDLLLTALRSSPKGLNEVELGKAVELPMIEMKEAINSLLKKGLLELLKGPSGLVFMASSKEYKKVLDLSAEERLIYQIIEAAGNKGIWSRDIRQKSNIDKKQVTKILKQLESAKLIKAVNSVVAVKRKMFMLYDLEPHDGLSGGVWYTDGELDTEFIEVLYSVSYKFLEGRFNEAKKNHSDNPLTCLRSSYASAEDVLAYVLQLKISSVKLVPSHIACILETLVFDGQVEKQSEGDVTVYKVSRIPSNRAPLLSSPCGVCPVFDQCSDNGVISPQTCSYFQDWLSF